MEWERRILGLPRVPVPCSALGRNSPALKSILRPAFGSWVETFIIKNGSGGGWRRPSRALLASEGYRQPNTPPRLKG